jgi:RNA polymerase sigma-70 factor (ECF subfamily)
VWLDHVRSAEALGRARSLDAPEEGGGPPDPRRGPSERAGDREEAQAVREAVAGLPQGERLVVELGVFQGLRYAEIASILQVPVGTVKSRMFSAVRRLRARLGRAKP